VAVDDKAARFLFSYVSVRASSPERLYNVHPTKPVSDALRRALGWRISHEFDRFLPILCMQRRSLIVYAVLPRHYHLRLNAVAILGIVIVPVTCGFALSARRAPSTAYLSASIMWLSLSSSTAVTWPVRLSTLYE
jgi:hypothetical protein